MLKKLLIVLLFCLIPTTAYGQYGKDTGLWRFLPAKDNPIQKSVCRVQMNKRHGTGFIISKTEILTAHHVVRKDKDATLYFPLIDFTIKGKVTRIDDDFDLAIIEVKKLPKGLLIIQLAKDPPKALDNVQFIGLAGRPDDIPRHYSGIVLQETFKDAPMFNAKGTQGDSGGPALNSEGDLVGMVQMITDFERGADMVYISPYSQNETQPMTGHKIISTSHANIKTFIENKHVRPEPPSPDSKHGI